jgi:F-type H+-transporting ATPase subunit epsilon
MALDVSVVTPEKVVWQGEAKFLIARAAGGDIGVLPGHAPFLAALHDARLIIEAEDGQTYAAVHGGFIEVFDDHVTVLTQVAELAEEIDVERARRQREEAERRLAEEDTPENRAALLRAASRIQTAAEAGILDIG